VSGYTVAWAIWIVYFLAVETIAILDKDRGDTLSEHVWAIVRSSSFAWFMVGGLLIWLVYHFLFEGRVS
jgi:hypothetical protein